MDDTLLLSAPQSALLAGYEAVLLLTAAPEEAAAIHLANGQTLQAWAAVLPEIRKRSTQESIWRLAFEALALDPSLFPAEELAVQFAEVFGRSAPVPLAMSSPPPQDNKTKPATGLLPWIHWPATINSALAQKMAASWKTLSKHNTQLRFELSYVKGIDPAATPVLFHALEELHRAGVRFVWAGLEAGLEALTTPEHVHVPESSLLQILWLSALGRHDDAEAMTFAHAEQFETVPPDWCLSHPGTVSASETSSSTASMATTDAEPAGSESSTPLRVDALAPAEVSLALTAKLLAHLQHRQGEFHLGCQQLRRWPLQALTALALQLGTAPYRQLKLHFVAAPLWLSLAADIADLYPPHVNFTLREPWC